MSSKLSPLSITQFETNRWVVLPAYVDSVEAERLREKILSCNVTRVHVPPRSDTWSQYAIETEPWVDPLFLDDALLSRIRLALQLPPSARLLNFAVWANGYTAGEYIGTHRDIDGDIQLLIHLRAPSPEDGGVLLLGESQLPCLLTPGDALLFEATTVLHQTTPVAERLRGTEAARLNVVGRYYFEK